MKDKDPLFDDRGTQVRGSFEDALHDALINGTGVYVVRGEPVPPLVGQQTQLPPGQGPLTDNERFELNAYRAKAKFESDVYLGLARSMQHDNRAWPRDNGPSMAEMQRAQNVNLHARELPSQNATSADFAKFHNAARPLVRSVLKIAARILFVILLVGVAVAVMV